MSRRDSLVAISALALALANCARKEPTKSTPAATVTGKRPESDLARVTLTAEAETRLGLTTKPVERRDISRARTVGGDVVPSSGRSIFVVAPTAGRLAAPGGELRVGQTVKRGDPLLRLTPVASVDRDLRATATRTQSVAEARGAAMEARFARAEKMLEAGSGSARAVEEARAERDTALAEIEAAKSRVSMLDRAPLEADVTVLLRAPEDGVVRAVGAPSSSLVPAGAQLVELVGTGSLWVKATVFVGDARAVRTDAPARVRPLTAPTAEVDSEALPVSGPPTADPATATFDLYYALAKDSDFRPGERVAVTLAYRGESKALVVPASAVIRDFNGNTWVYEALANHAYERRLVDLERVQGADAVLKRGPAEGTSIVTVGTAELFGVELGVGK